MNPQMTQLLAQSLGFNAEQYSALQNGDLSPLITSSKLDPMMVALLSSMANTGNSSTDEPVRRDRYEEALIQAENRIQLLKEQVAAAHTMMNYIAETFGSCRFCWGLNRMCAHCRGKGKPGFTQPGQEELRTWVEPALKRLGLKIVNEE